MTPHEKRPARDESGPDPLTPEQRKLWHETFPQGIDRNRLTPDELELWDEWFPEGVTTASRLWEFGYICMLELSGPPADLIEWMTALGFDPAWPLQYMESMRQKLEAERRARRRSESSLNRKRRSRAADRAAGPGG